jgi:hypothetical protein
MRLRITLIFSFLLALISLVHVALAHTPLEPPFDNESLATAYGVPDPTKSWAIYAELHEGGEAQYYRLKMEQGERLRLMLFIPVSEKERFKPNLVVMGPAITSHDAPPEFVETAGGVGVTVLEGQLSAEPAYEPFTPSAYYYLADLDLDVSVAGTYHVAVYEAYQGGRYGLAIGYREEFGLDEWLMIPIDVVGVHEWEGQSIGLILAPMLAALSIGFALPIWRRRAILREIFNVTGVSAGLLYLGSGAMMFTQMILALAATGPDFSAVLTIVFTLLPILLGVAILRLTIKDPKSVTKRVRAFIAILGLLGLFTWAGLLIGPALALLTSILPAKS